METGNKGNQKKTRLERTHRVNTSVHSMHPVNKFTFEKLKCMYTNADSLSNKMNELRSLVYLEKPHIIAITEVKPKNYKDITLTDFNLEGYEIHSVNVTKRQGRGIIIYAHNSLKVNDIELCVNYEESCWIELCLNKSDKMLLGCIYRSDSGTQENNLNLMKILQHAISLEYSHYLLVGDFNYNHISWENWTTTKSTSSNEYLFLECIRDLFLFQHVTRPTRYRADNQPSTIDLIMSNEENMIGEIAYYSPLGLSDHSVLVFDYHCYLKPENISRMKYYLDKGDYNAMRQDMSIDWDSACDGCEHNIDSMWLLFINKLNDAKNKHIPHKLTGGRPPWGDKGKFPIDEKVRKEIRKKHRCWEKAYTDKTESAKKKYNQQRNKVRKLTRKLYKDYEKKIAKEAKSNPKGFCQYAKSKTKTSSTIAQLQVAPDNDELTTNDTEKAELLQKYFSSVFTREPPEDIPTVTEHNVQSQLNCLTVSEKQVFDKLSKLDISKSAGPDDIQPRILRELANTLSVPFAKIFNFSIRTSTLPTDWKMGNITAIFKKGQRKLPTNYRPISLTSIVCKVLESLVRDAIIKHFKDNLLFSSNQFGFISGRSTTLQLLHVLETWSEILDRGGNIDCIYMDFMKAFDTVPHKRLLSKIQSYCIGDQLLGWISSFLSDRQQRVCINGCHSNWGSVTSGIPQGSVLGPILFVIYINVDMVNRDGKQLNSISLRRRHKDLQRNLVFRRYR